MIEQLERGVSREQEPPMGRELLIVGHTYQPPRETLLPLSNSRLEVLPWVNEQIARESHKPIFMERKLPDGTTEQGLPEGGIFSFYATLRDWFKAHDPESFRKIKDNIQSLPDKEYRILGDPYVHAILPLLNESDQDLLIKIGIKAFEDDFGFKPKGIWLPETAVSSSTLKALVKNGYEFVILREDQLENSHNDPMFVQVEEEGGQKLGEIAIVHFAHQTSDSVSFKDDFTTNADIFLERVKQTDPDRKTISVATDTEFYGHHKKGRVEFLDHLTRQGTLRAHGFSLFNVKEKLQDPNRQYTTIREATSWSCEHALGRWTGECDCGGEPYLSDTRKLEKKRLLNLLTGYGQRVDDQLRDLNPNWGENFIPFFLAIREAMFGKGVLKGNEDPLFLAKASHLVGMTSCGWFFPLDEATNEIPKKMAQEIQRLLPQINESPLPRAA